MFDAPEAFVIAVEARASGERTTAEYRVRQSWVCRRCGGLWRNIAKQAGRRS
jgi:hypothetical protein